jgi:transposase
MAAGPDISSLSHAQKDALIASLMGQVAALTARIAELEAKLGLPPKTPDNSSVPPSKGQKASEASTPKAKANPHAGAHRPLHPNPTSVRIVSALVCQGCGSDVSNVGQSPCETYDRVEIPDIVARLRSFAYNLIRARGCDNIRNARWRAALDLNIVLEMPSIP